MKDKMGFLILLALIFGFLAGIVDHYLPVSLTKLYNITGHIFLNALKMIVVPLIAASMVSSVAKIDGHSIGKLGIKTLLYYMVTTLLAIITGIVFVNLLSPGTNVSMPTSTNIKLSVSGNWSKLWTIFERMVPPNIIEAAAKGQLLGIITFFLIFGFLLRGLNPQKKALLLTFWDGILDIMIRMTELIMLAAPIGIFALIAEVASKTGLSSIKPLLLFALTVILGLATHFFITLPILLILLGKTSPIKHYKHIWPALLMAFSTSSSMATLSVTLRQVKKEGVSNKVASFVLPLGATINMDGTALYESVAALFIAQLYGLNLSITTQIMIVILALLTSVGVAGVPSASLVAIVIILEAVGLPPEALGLILTVDRPLDMLRTAVNVFSDSCGAVIIDNSQHH